MTTTRSEVTFRVEEYASGKAWIAIEQLRGDLDVEGLLGLDLREGHTTYEQAQEIANYLNERVQFVSLTPHKKPRFRGGA
jgi:hypothetical protein